MLYKYIFRKKNAKRDFEQIVHVASVRCQYADGMKIRNGRTVGYWHTTVNKRRGVERD